MRIKIGFWDKVKAHWHYWTKLKHSVEASRRYALEECGMQSPGFRATHEKRILAVVGGHPILSYVELGYDWLAPYYNPLFMFDEVHYFQKKPAYIRQLDFGYPLYIHYFRNSEDITETCRKHRVSLIRAYDPHHGRLALPAKEALGVPLIVSVH